MKRILLLSFSFILSIATQAQTYLWGTSYMGGTNDKGVFFQYDPATSAYTKKLDFNGAVNGRGPFRSLTNGTDGKLYGVTRLGGTSDSGTIFQYDPATSTHTKKLDFDGPTKGANPTGALTQASDGKLYGMTTYGGTNNKGVLFQYDPATSTYTKKLDFDGAAKGANPTGTLTQASDGKLYGMTYAGGTNNLGVIFQYDPATSTFIKKLDFNGVANGSRPYDALRQASDGKLYGMASAGGSNSKGVLFQYDPAASTYTKKVDFNGAARGAEPHGSLLQASDGKLYGMTRLGGTNNLGVIFQYDPATSTFTRKLNFNGSLGSANGSKPHGTFIQASDGKLYGMTYEGGTNDKGVLFQYNYTTSAYTKKLDFNGSANGKNPVDLIEAVVAANTITTSSVNSTNCSGNSISVSYTITGTFNAGNIFTAQLSNSSGSFASPVTIGTLSSTTSGTISATIPSGTLSGTDYRIRVISSNPAVTGTDNGSNITINALPAVSANASATTVCAGTSVTLTGSGASTYTWTGGVSNGVGFIPSATTTYTVTGTDANGCTNKSVITITIKNNSSSITTQTACNSYLWNATTYTATGIYTYTTTNAAGCDSVATLNLTINNSSTSTTNQTACNSYLWNAVTYTASGTYTYTTQNASGCDSVATLNLTINNSSTSTTAQTACNSYLWNAATYTATGTYTFNTTNAAGCDSLATLNLTINNHTSSNTTQTACNSYLWNATTYTASGTYTYNTTNAAGCDSTAILNLTINNSSSSTTNQTACNSYLWNAATYTASGTYMYTTTNAAGCDSVATLNLTINNSSTSTTNQTACNSYLWNATTYTVSGTYTYNTTNAAGCDSVATLNLTINNSSSSTTNHTTCNSYLWNATTYTASGTYTYTTINAAGCDSVATLNLTINNSSTSTANQTACNSYLWNATTYTASGTYTYNTTNAAGCDSTATLNLTINNSSSSTTNQTACNSYLWNATTYTASGTYTYTTTNAAGCDSTATLNLTINNSSSSTTNHTACNSYLWNAATYTASGTYTYTTQNSVGCDSLATLNLIINNHTSSNTTQTACNSYLWNATTYTASGTYTYNTTNAAGCDSTATLNLTINHSSSSTTNQTACNSYLWNATTYTASGTYTYNTTNAAGCDSTATLNLTINNSSTSTTNQTACNSYLWNATTYTASGTYTYNTTNAAGCDSVATLNLTINNSSTSTTAQTACNSYLWNAATYTATGTYTFNTTNAAGCDSVATLVLIVNPLPSVSANASATMVCAGTSVTLSGSGASTYTWTAGVSNGVGFIPSETTTYTVTGTNANGCTNTAIITITVNPLPSLPGAFTASASSVNRGQNGVIYTVPNDPGVTYLWAYSGTGATINGSGNSVTIDFSMSAIGGTLSVTATNGCNSAARTIAITIGTTGPNSSQSPYLLPTVPTATFTSILTATDVVGGYKMCGTPDGIGAFDNGNGTFTLLMNHEFGSTAGVVRAHGSKGAFVSKWVINKSTLSVVSGADLIQTVKIWNGSSYDTYNSGTPSALAAFNRFCSADLPPVSAFYNSATGLGTQERIYMNGEESGNEGRAFGHIATGANAGTTYELPYLGKFSWENAVANPTPSDKTIVAGTDDSTPGQIYFYIGTKTNTGTDIDKAGLNGGKLFGVAVSGLLTEVSASIPTAGTAFSLSDLGQVHNLTGAVINSNSNTAGVTTFLRPEDGAWDPSNPSDFYFVTTNAFASPSRLWKLHFTDISNPELGGTITAVLDGTEGQKMFDNMTIDNSGHALLQEDVGNNAHIGKIWQYTIATDVLIQVGQHDPTRFLTGAPNFLTQDEEASGIIDAQSILGPGKFLLVDQAHYGIAGEVVEGGQILTFFNPDTYNANPNVYAVTGGGSYCAGDTIGLPVGLAASQSGVEYQLILNNITNVGSPITGTGSPISFGNKTADGIYTVLATDTITSHTSVMMGSASIIVNPLPTATITASGPIAFCPGGSVTLTAPAGMSSYLWSNGATTQAIVVDTTGNSSVTITNVNGCSATSSTVTVTVNTLPEDINRDGIVSQADLNLLSIKLGIVCTCPEDVNGDGIVSQADLNLLSIKLGTACN